MKHNKKKPIKRRFKNLHRAYRTQIKRLTHNEIIAWIRFYNVKDAEIMDRLFRKD